MLNLLVVAVVIIILLAILILSHEFGHFIAARKNGIKVDEFGFGFPPRIVGLQYLKEAKKWRVVWGNKAVEKLEEENAGQKATIYSLNWLPLGGFVKIKGENGESLDPDSFGAKKVWRRTVVLAAGVFMNIVLAGVLLSIGYLVGLPQMTDQLADVSRVKDRKIEVSGVLKDMPAEKAGIMAGDVIAKIDKLDNPRLKELQQYVDEHKNENVSVTIRRGNETLTKEIKPVVNPETGKGGLGVQIAEVGLITYPWYAAIYHGFVDAFIYLKEIVIAFAILIKGLFTGSGAAGEVTGPVGIAVMTGRIARLGLSYLIQFAALLSLNLAIVNILPIPALDGGRILFLLIGKIRGKEVNKNVEQTTHLIGFVLLLVLLAVVTFKDLRTYGSLIVGTFQKMF